MGILIDETKEFTDEQVKKMYQYIYETTIKPQESQDNNSNINNSTNDEDDDR